MTIGPVAPPFYLEVVECLKQGKKHSQLNNPSVERCNWLFERVIESNPSDEELVKAILGLEKLTSVKLVDRKISQEVMKAINAMHVVNLDLTRCAIPAEELKHLHLDMYFVYFRENTFVDAEGKTIPFSNEILVSIARRCNQLIELILDCPTEIDKKTAQELTGRLTKLESLGLQRTKAVSDAAAKQLAKFKELTALDLSGCEQVTDTAFRYLLNTTGPRTLIFNTMQVIPPVDQASPLPGAEVFNNPSVKVLDLRYLPYLEAKHLKGVRFPHLQKLMLDSNPQLTNSMLDSVIAAAPALTALSLGSCKKLTGAGLQKLRGVPTLERLAMTELPALNDETLKELLTLPSLHHLNVADCTNITSAAFSEGGMSLTSLMIPGCTKVGDAALIHLAETGTLELLDVSDVPGIGDKGLKALAAGCPLRKLVLKGQEKVTDATLEALAEAEDLESLVIKDCRKLTDKGLTFLAGHPQLKELRIQPEEQFSTEAIQNLKAHNPKLVVVEG